MFSLKKKPDDIGTSAASNVGNHDAGNGMIQREMNVSQKADSSEKEAADAADRVLSMAESNFVQRKCTHCEEEEKARRKPLQSFIQKKENENGSKASDNLNTQINTTRGSGNVIDTRTKSFMENRFGADFSKVSIHTGNYSIQMSNQLSAQAFTVGRDIYFNRNTYNPESEKGKHLLAHELTHTIQQAGKKPTIQKAPAPKVPKKTIWMNVGFDSSAVANEATMKKLRGSIAKLKSSIASCCEAKSKACNINVKTNYDWVRYNKPAPKDGDYDSDVAKDDNLRDKNLNKIEAPAGGLKILVTESTLSQTWQGERIFPRANTGDSGVLWNPNLAADDTIAHEAGHAAGYTGDSEGDSHHTDEANLMSPGSIRLETALPDDNWCEQMAKTAK